MIKIEDLEKYATINRGFQGIPGIEITPKGRLWATWYTGGDTEGPENFAVLVTSADGGKHWSEPVAVIDPPGNYRAYDPTLWIGPDGILRWFWAETESLDGCITNGIDGVWFVACSNIEDDKPEWSGPVRIANGVMMNKPIVLSDGDWVFPTALWCKDIGGKRAPEELQCECFSNSTVSTDGGCTFCLRGGADIPNRAFDEHHIVELKDGRLWCLVRTEDGIGDSFSSDKGATWSKGRSNAMVGPCSRFFIKRLASANLLLVNHVFDKNEKNVRKNLTAWISEDDGKSWLGGLMLDERRDVSYPDGCQDDDGNIWIIYDHSRYKHGDILFAKFTEEDVLAGKIVSKTSKLKQLINTTGGVKIRAKI